MRSGIMRDFDARTRIAWDRKRGGYFVHTLWEAPDGHPLGADRGATFFINLFKGDGSAVFLGNYNHMEAAERVRASHVAHEQLKLVLSLSARDRGRLRARAGRKMTIDEIRADRPPGAEAAEAEAGDGERHAVRVPLRSVTRSDVVNEATKAVMRDYVGERGADAMRDALAAFLTRTPNGGSTRLFLELQGLRADTIAVSPRAILADGGPDHAAGYDIVLTCSPLGDGRGP